MGCSGSKDDSKDENQNKVITTATNNNVHDAKIKLDDENEKTSFDSPSPIELLQEDQTRNKVEPAAAKVTKHISLNEKIELSKDSSISNAWTPRNGTTAMKHHNDQAKLLNDIKSDSESEFGREGIDTHSTSFGGIRRKSSGPNKPLPKVIQLDDRQTQTPDDVPRLTKKLSEEPFDPTPLIDVNKFKAVNAPKEVRKVDVVLEPRTNQGQPMGQATTISPTEFYDEDEKELMASIEQDFVTTALPGVVT